MVKDITDKLVTFEEGGPTVKPVGTNALGIPKFNAMVVPSRAESAEDIEEREREMLASLEFPIPFWDGDTGVLEPLMQQDYAVLEAAGIDPVDFEIAVLEDFLERGENNG